jgi:hypothetical protein
MAMPQTSQFPEARIAGHAIGLITGIAALFGGAASVMNHMAPVLSGTLLILGILLPVLALFSFNHSRIAWSFLNAIMIVLALVTLFGAPKIRNMLHIPLPAAGVIPIVLALGVIALMLVAHDYRGTVSQKSQNVAR